MIYLACFALSAFFAYLAQRQEKRWRFLLLSAASVLLPVLLATFRDLSVGTDTSHYFEMTRYWGTASKVDSLAEYMAFYLPKGYGEYLFALLVGIIGQTGNFTLFLFVVHAWIMIFVYIGAWRLRDRVQPWLVLLLFFLAFYNHSLNIMRQYMALSLMFAVLADLPQKKYLRYLIAVVIATMFHTSGLLSICPLLIHVILYSDFGKIKRGFEPSVRSRQIFIFVSIIVMIVLFSPLVHLFVKVGLLHKKYKFYVSEPFTSYNLLVSLFLGVELIALWLLGKNLKKKAVDFEFQFTISVVYFLLYQITAVVLYGKRIAACCALANLVTLAQMTDGLGDEISVTLPKHLGGKTLTFCRFLGKLDEKKKKILGTVLVVGGVFAYWAYVYLLRNSSRTFPYIFSFQ